jgi:hypothetical protein
MQTELEDVPEPKIYGVKISQDENQCYCISVRHAGDFCLADYEELEFEVTSARLVRRQ